MSDLTLGNVFCPAPKHMIRLSVDYRHDSKIPIRLWKSLVGDTPKIITYGIQSGLTCCQQTTRYPTRFWTVIQTRLEMRWVPVEDVCPQRRCRAPQRRWSLQKAPAGCSGCQSPCAARCHPAGWGTAAHRHDSLKTNNISLINTDWLQTYFFYFLYLFTSTTHLLQ